MWRNEMLKLVAEKVCSCTGKQLIYYNKAHVKPSKKQKK